MIRFNCYALPLPSLPLESERTLNAILFTFGGAIVILLMFHL